MFLKELLVTVNRRLSNLERFNNVPRVNKESVAEHCFYVAFYVMMLSKYIKVDVERSLKLALIHDLEESISGDFPNTFKLSYPDLNISLEETNFKIIKDIFKDFDDSQEYINLWIESRSLETEESRLVKIADLLSVLFYTSDEGQLGNSFMSKIYLSQKELLLRFISEYSQYEFIKEII